MGGSTGRWVWTVCLLVEPGRVHLAAQPGVAHQSGSSLSTNHSNTTPLPVGEHVTSFGPRLHERKHSGNSFRKGFPSGRKVTIESRPSSSSQQ